jgi:hypothetical protein
LWDALAMMGRLIILARLANSNHGIPQNQLTNTMIYQ